MSSISLVGATHENYISSRSSERFTIFRGASQILTFASKGKPKRGLDMADPGLVKQGAVVVHNGNIVDVGNESDVLNRLVNNEVEEIDAGGRVLMPGFVDPHTHMIFGGERSREFEARLLGDHFLHTLKTKGGLYTTTLATRLANDENLAASLLHRLETFVKRGTTTIEVKSGYGLSVAEELRHLRVLMAVRSRIAARLEPTVLALHARPLEYFDAPEIWVQETIEDLLPRCVAEGLATACDVHVQPGVFSVAQCRMVLDAGKRLGLGGHVHADQMEWTGGSELAAESGALSADHVGYISNAGISALASSGTVAVLIPGSTMFVPGEQAAPARKLIDSGVTVAISTDFNPGSSPILSTPLVIGLSCALYRMSVAEVLSAVTINAACALGKAKSVGSIECGKSADLILLEANDYREVSYRFGEHLVRDVYIGGRHTATSPVIGTI